MGSPSRRLALLLVASATGAAGCVGDFAAGGDGVPDAGGAGAASDGPSLRDRFRRDVAPILDGSCAVCHAQNGGAGPTFLHPDAYDTLHAWPGMITRDPMVSHLVTKGLHAGPALTSSQLAAIVPWLALEGAALPDQSLDSAPTTAPVHPAAGANSVSLAGLAAGLDGTTLTFDAHLVGASLVLSQLELHAGPGAAVRVVHPLFVVWSGGKKTPDPVDSLAGVDLTVARGGTATVGPGTVVLQEVGALDELSVAFAKITPSGVLPDMGTGGDGGVLGGGCKATATFTKMVQKSLVARCVSCHAGQNGQATAAVDMTRVADLAAAAQAAACAQVRTKVTPAAPAQSLLLKTVNPAGGANHPYKLPDGPSFDAFAASTSTWISAEK